MDDHLKGIRASSTAKLEVWAAACGAIAIGLSGLALLGWIAGVRVLTSFRADWATMKVNTAIAVALLGSALILPACRRSVASRKMSMIAAAAAAALGLMTMVEYALDQNLGIDEFLGRDWPPSPYTIDPGRMAPNTALELVLLGAATVLLRARRPRVAASQLMTAPVAIVAFMETLRYAYGGHPLPGHERFTEMPLPSALACIALSGGLFLASPEAGIARLLVSPHLGGRMLRRLLPVVVLVPAMMSLARVRGQLAGLFDNAFGSAVVTAVVVFLLASAVGWNASVLDHVDAQRSRVSSALDAEHEALRAEVAERKRHEEELRVLQGELEQRVRERTAELEAVNRELEAFSYSVSHDLRAPLRWLDSFTEMLAEHAGPRLDDDSRVYLRHIAESGKTMRAIVDSLLELSRITRAELVREPVDLSALAGEVIQELASAEPQRRVEITRPTSLTALADARLLRLALANLLQNACKFTRQRDRSHIEIGRTVEDGLSAYYVRDDGVGFDMLAAGRLFRPFERLHSAADFEGSGIGLAIVRRVAQRHGGRVWARSAPGEGATFFFTLGEVERDT